MHGTLDPASDPDGYAQVRQRGASVVAIGKFDGVHRGHCLLLSRTLAEARQRGLQAGVVTFDVHPREVLSGVPWYYLTTPQERTDLFADAGMDFVLLLRSTPELFAVAAEHFAVALARALDCRAVVVGANFRFGRGALGDANTLARAAGVHAIALDLLAGSGDAVSSSRIRQELEAGRVDRAAELLGRPISVSGVLEVEALRRWVVKVPPRLALPAPGAYEGRVVFTEPEVSARQPAVVFVPASRYATQLRVVPYPGVNEPGRGRLVRVLFERARGGHALHQDDGDTLGDLLLGP